MKNIVKFWSSPWVSGPYRDAGHAGFPEECSYYTKYWKLSSGMNILRRIILYWKWFLPSRNQVKRKWYIYTKISFLCTRKILDLNLMVLGRVYTLHPWKRERQGGSHLWGSFGCNITKEWIRNRSHSFGCYPNRKSRVFNFARNKWMFPKEQVFFPRICATII